MKLVKFSFFFLLISLAFSCHKTKQKKNITAKEILGNPEYLAISFGGFREKTRETCPTIEELKEDMRLLSVLGIKIIRTYSTQLFPHAERTLEAIDQLKKENPDFEMYVMLGAWMECEGAWTDNRNHEKGNTALNDAEFRKALDLIDKYPKIIKIVAIGNESMVHWAESYFVSPDIILDYVEQLQHLKFEGLISRDLWVTSSDNFASWGGGSADYHNEDLKTLIETVDYISMHTYPFHDTHYNPKFWQIEVEDTNKTALELSGEAMLRARDYAISQYESTKKFVHSIAPNKPIHIGETGWATSSHKNYGDNGSRAAGEYQQKLYYDYMRKWSNENKLSCFFFEAFNEQWKDSTDKRGSENHFGLINLKGEAKYVLWESVDSAIFSGLKRNGFSISKTYGGNEELLLSKVLAPPLKSINN